MAVERSHIAVSVGIVALQHNFRRIFCRVGQEAPAGKNLMPGLAYRVTLPQRNMRDRQKERSSGHARQIKAKDRAT